MSRLISSYIVREVLPPCGLALAVFTFVMLLPPIMNEAEDLIRAGVDGAEIVRMLVLLLPQSLSVTIPMALLVGVLMGLGRLSGDRETVALQACGVSLVRILVPLLGLAAAAAAVNAWIMLSILPDANQAFREVALRVQANRAEGDVAPRVFYTREFPGLALYVEEVAAAGAGWSRVFLADVQQPDRPDLYLAARGRVAVNRTDRTVAIVLEDGERHRVDPDTPGTYEVHRFDELMIQVDAESVFPAAGPERGLRELRIPELRAEAAAMRAAGLSPHAPIMEIHKKVSIPFASFVFVLLGVGFGVSSRKDGRLASFALGIGVIFAYYVLMYIAPALAKGQQVSPHLAMWLPNLVLGLAGAALVRWRSGSVERTMPRLRIGWPARRRPAGAPEAAAPGTARETAHGAQGTVSGAQGTVSDAPGTRPRPADAPAGQAAAASDAGGPGRWLGATVLDGYVTRMYLRWVALAFVGLLGIFYVTTFIDLADKLFKAEASGQLLLTYFWYATPQWIYYVLPVAALVAALVTIGLLTRTSELTVMKACGISLYRAALPLIGCSLLWSGVLFGLGETVLAGANRRADTLNRQIRTGRTQTIDLLHRRWLHADGVIYHYLDFDADRRAFDRLSVLELAGRPWTLARRTWARTASFDGAWQGRDVWARDFADAAPAVRRDPARALPTVPPPAVFAAERPAADAMSFRELARHIETLRARGFDVVDLVVSLHRKTSFPFVTVILTLIAVPFAVTTGSRGALYGIGVGIVLAFTYWTVLSVFGALGSAGVLAPAAAAWAPNVLFGASAGYFLLAVRT